MLETIHKVLSLSFSSKIKGSLTSRRCRLLDSSTGSKISYLKKYLNTTSHMYSSKEQYTRRTDPKEKRKKFETIEIWQDMSVKELAKALKRDETVIDEAMTLLGLRKKYATCNGKFIDLTVVKNIAKICGKNTMITNPIKKIIQPQENRDLTKQPVDPSKLKTRPPIVTVMGHVDHGKTTLLDSLRNTKVVETEFGGITQHIGAFSVKVASGDTITFLDTPGHAAFATMRSRGAEVTDIVVLVVAVDDGVMEQTIESIKMAQRAGVPIVVALNKIDKLGSDIEKAKLRLLEQGIQVEDYGGDVQVVPISALKRTNLDLLTEAILTQAEIMDLKADPTGKVEGVILESKLDPARGKLSTVLIKRGTLTKGKILVSGVAYAKVRMMFDSDMHAVESAPPSTPVQISVWQKLPSAGDEVLEAKSEKEAHSVTRWREQRRLAEKQQRDEIFIAKKAQELAKITKERQLLTPGERLKPHDSNENSGLPRINLIIKGDVNGSVEAILDILDTYDVKDECLLDIVHFGVGSVTESDIELAVATNAVIYAFNVQVPPYLIKKIEEKEITICSYNVIYRLIDDLKQKITEKIPVEEEEKVLGEADFLEQFEASEGKIKVPVAGCQVVTGELKKDAIFRVVRNSEIIFEGKLDSMRHHKSEVPSVKKGVQCGLMFRDFCKDFEVGDKIICYELHKITKETSWKPGF